MYMDNEIVDLEMKISYLEDYVNQLNNIVIEQGSKVERLIKSNNQLRDKINLLEENIKEPVESTPPPHY